MSDNYHDKFDLKVAWIFHQSDYAELREVDGCEKLRDIQNDKEDKENAMKAAKNMGISEDEINVFTDICSKTFITMS